MSNPSPIPCIENALALRFEHFCGLVKKLYWVPNTNLKQNFPYEIQNNWKQFTIARKFCMPI